MITSLPKGWPRTTREGHKVYTWCDGCDRYVRVRGFFGDLHFCSVDA